MAVAAATQEIERRPRAKAVAVAKAVAPATQESERRPRGPLNPTAMLAALPCH